MGIDQIEIKNRYQLSDAIQRGVYVRGELFGKSNWYHIEEDYNTYYILRNSTDSMITATLNSKQCISILNDEYMMLGREMLRSVDKAEWEEGVQWELIK